MTELKRPLNVQETARNSLPRLRDVCELQQQRQAEQTSAADPYLISYLRTAASPIDTVKDTLQLQ